MVHSKVSDHYQEKDQSCICVMCTTSWNLVEVLYINLNFQEILDRRECIEKCTKKGEVQNCALIHLFSYLHSLLEYAFSKHYSLYCALISL